MSKKETLQAFLSPQRLRELAGPKVYARGEEYSARNNVQLHEHTRDEAIGEVMGSQPYRVELRLTSEGLIAECTCPAMSDYGFCKHAVTLGLHLIHAPPPTAKKTIKARRGAMFHLPSPPTRYMMRDGIDLLAGASHPLWDSRRLWSLWEMIELKLNLLLNAQDVLSQWTIMLHAGRGELLYPNGLKACLSDFKRPFDELALD